MTTANIGLIWPSYSDPDLSYTPTFSTGSWSTDLPLANLQDERLHRVARSTDALAASSKFVVDLKRDCAIAAMAIPVHNLTKDATFRIRGSANSNGTTSPVYDSTTLSAFDPAVTAQDLADGNLALKHVFSPAAATARYWCIEVIDTGNADGHIDLGRLCLGALYQPSINIAYDAEDNLESESTVKITDGASSIVDDRPRRRTLSAMIPNLPDSEVYAYIRKMQRQLGIRGQFFYMFDPTDTSALKYERSYLARFRALTAVKAAYYSHSHYPIEIVEAL
jgi:hypothetical protein